MNKPAQIDGPLKELEDRSDKHKQQLENLHARVFRLEGFDYDILNRAIGTAHTEIALIRDQIKDMQKGFAARIDPIRSAITDLERRMDRIEDPKKTIKFEKALKSLDAATKTLSALIKDRSNEQASDN